MEEYQLKEPKTQKTFTARLLEFSPGGLLKLLLACLGVGILLAVLNIDPRRVWSDFFGTIADAWEKGWDLATYGVDYLILGAILVIPAFIVLRIIKALQKK